MGVQLEQIIIENFKSFKGKIKFGPFMNFNAIIGPNGAGKSNFMDAVSFVMGARTQDLRVRKLSDLVYGAAFGHTEIKSASVTAVLVNNNGDETGLKKTVFQRSINSSRYKINDNVVKEEDYLKELASFIINVKAKNFLVFQGTVECIAIKNPKDITQLFEKISGSGEFKQTYKDLEDKLIELQQQCSNIHQTKVQTMHEVNQAKEEIKEVEKYNQVKTELDKAERLLYLCCLYKEEENAQRLEQQLRLKEQELSATVSHKIKLEESLKNAKKANGVSSREAEKIGQNIREIDIEIEKKKACLVKAKEKLSHGVETLKTVKSNLETAKSHYEKCVNDLTKLEKELMEHEKDKENLRIEEESDTRDIALNEIQTAEYERLKIQAENRAAALEQQLVLITHKQKCDKDRLNYAKLTQDQTKENNCSRKCEVEEKRERLQKLQEKIRSAETELHELRSRRNNLEKEIAPSKNSLEQNAARLESIRIQIAEMNLGTDEEKRAQEKSQIVQTLKDLYPQVRGRVFDICTPKDEKYRVATTKVIGRKFLNAIVVDTEAIGVKCIEYLKEQKLSAETFIPLDTIRPDPVRNDLRNIREPSGTIPVYDTLNFDPAIWAAVKFVTKNAVICETPEDATYVAFEMSQIRNNAVSLDGIYYQKSGIISGGPVELANQAKIWDRKKIGELTNEKKKLAPKVEQLSRNVFKMETELRFLIDDIEKSEARLNAIKADASNEDKRISELENVLAQVSDELASLQTEIELRERSIAIWQTDVDALKTEIGKVEDVVFAEFCQEIGVDTMRYYKDYQNDKKERKEKLGEIECKIDKRKQIIERQEKKKNDKLAIVNTCELNCEKKERELKEYQEEVRNRNEALKEETVRLEVQNTELKTKEGNIETTLKTLDKVKKRLAEDNDTVKSTERNITKLQGDIAYMQNEKHKLLVACKMKGISLSFISGNMDDVVLTEVDSQSSEEDQPTPATLEAESRIRVDYDSLPDDWKNPDDPTRLTTAVVRLTDSVEMLRTMLDKLANADFKSVERLEFSASRSVEASAEAKRIHAKLKKTKAEFEAVRAQRNAAFTECFEAVTNEVMTIYQSLVQSDQAQAILMLEDMENPYLGGVMYSCIPPGKRIQNMSNLSGGEQTMAALALLFAIHRYRPAPFFVLDEVDAALDADNMDNLGTFIESTSGALQTFLITHQEDCYCNADFLIGLYKKTVGDETYSKHSQLVQEQIISPLSF